MMTGHHDELTGLPDRIALREAINAAITAGEPLALAVLDVDNFTGVNDELGAEAGDRLLRALGEVIRENGTGQAYRVSGDEFAVALAGASLEQAFLAMEELRGRIHAAQERFGLGDGREITVTIGVAQYPRDAKDEGSLMRTADAALLSAKEAGRNAVALPPNEEMVMKSCYYSTGSIRRLKALAERLGRKESFLLREALDDLLRKHDLR
jgi:diguanylate cyclase